VSKPPKVIRPKADEIEPVYQAFGLRVRMIREALDLTQEDIATRVGMVRASVTNIEIGRQRVLLAEVSRFASALGTSPKNLLKGIFW
jgi:transcriptional regulator with XRE-family HTH domain